MVANVSKRVSKVFKGVTQALKTLVKVSKRVLIVFITVTKALKTRNGTTGRRRLGDGQLGDANWATG